MNLRLIRLASACLFVSLAVLAAPPARAAVAPDTLSDSTWVARWPLANGIDVTVRNIPGCPAVAMVVLYRVGRDQDPRGREGFADLACEVLFTAAAGTAPERTRAQMESIRPLGWNLQTAPRFTLLSEVATRDRFPVVLRELAVRMRGVTVTDSLLASAKRTVAAELAQKYLVASDLTLYNRLRDVALGLGDDELMQRVSGRSLQAITVAEMRERLRRLYVPANAVLAIAGDFDGVDLPALTANLFAGIPGGTAVVEPPSPVLTATQRAVQRAGLKASLGVAGVIAPALTDSLSPDFYFHSLVIGRYCTDLWGTSKDLPLRFKYSIFADPQIVHFFPPVAPDETDADQVGVALQDAVESMGGTIVDPHTYEETRVNHQWLLGGPMTPALVRRMQSHSGTLFTLATTMGVRALWGSDAFWMRYRARFMDPGINRGGRWIDYFVAPDRIVRLLLVPARR